MARLSGQEFRIDIDVEHAQREADRVRDMLAALRRRHDLSRYEYTSIVRIVPGSDTFAHPVLTLGNRFAESEDLLLSTYLHEQMHWYLWYLGTPERDMVAPFYDELVRRYPDAPDRAARRRAQLRRHLFASGRELAGDRRHIRVHRPRARHRVARATRSYRWIYRTVLKDWDLLGELYERHDIVPIRTADTLRQENARPRVPPSTAGGEKRPQQRRRPRLLDPAVDLGRVVAGRLAEDARAVLDAAALADRPRRSRAGGRARTRWPPRTSDRAPA